MRREIETFGKKLSIEQDLRIVNKEAGAIIWDCTFVIMKAFENVAKYPPGHFTGKKILELGSGTGVLGIILLLMGAGHVVLTDKQVLLPLIEHNIELNCSLEENYFYAGDEKALSVSDLKQRYTVRELMWGETPIEEKFDCVVVCDCVYESKDMWMPLAQCLQMVADVNPEVEVLLAYELRSKKDAAFFPFITQFFSVEPIDEEDYHPEWYSPEIKIFTLKKLKELPGRSIELSEILAFEEPELKENEIRQENEEELSTEEEQYDTTTYALF